MDRNTAVEMLVRTNPIYAITNYATFLLLLYIGVSTYKKDELFVMGIPLALWTLLGHYCIVRVLRWHAERRLTSPD